MSKIATIIPAYAGFTRNLMRQHLTGNPSLHEHLLRNPELHNHLLRNPELRNVFLNNESTLLDAMKSSPPPEVEVEVEVDVEAGDQEWETILEWLESLSEIIG